MKASMIMLMRSSTQKPTPGNLDPNPISWKLVVQIPQGKGWENLQLHFFGVVALSIHFGINYPFWQILISSVL